MEGVMIRGQRGVVTTVRDPNGKVNTQVRPVPSFSSSRVCKIPFIRGILVLVESLVVGINSLVLSANVALEEDEAELSGWPLWIMLGASMLLAVGLFFMAPLFLTRLMAGSIDSSLIFHLVEGVVRLGIFLGYLKLLTLLSDIKRTFAYHGAEHKAINAYEGGSRLEIHEVRHYSTTHPRCGTAFLLMVLVIAVLVFALVGQQPTWIMVLSRILLLPVIAGISYELTQFGSRHMDNPVMHAVMAPGLWLQALTTAEPDDSQLEVGIAALKEAIAIDERAGRAGLSGVVQA